MLTTSILVGLPVALPIFAATVWLLTQRTTRDAATATPNHAPAEDNYIDFTLWPGGWPHEAPDEPFTRYQAHVAMQSHRGCLIENCPRKAAAFQALVEFGAIKPSKP